MRLDKRLLTILTVIGSLALGAVAQEKKDEKPASPPAAVRPPITPPDRSVLLAKTLNLTEEQRLKIKPILEQEMADLKALREDKNMPREGRMTKWKEIRENTRLKVKPLLNDEQAQKWEQMRNPKPLAPPPGLPIPGQGAAPANPPAPPKAATK